MVRKFLSIVILISMMLHSFSRLGVISYLYSNRHDIAYSLGITAEKVISLCRSDYFPRHELKIEDGEDHQVPVTLSQSQEITLFTPTEFFITLETGEIVLGKFITPHQIQRYSPPVSDIFHPPLI